MNKLLFTTILVLVAGTTTRAQSTGIGTTTPDASAKLEVSATSQGFLPPRVTVAQRNAISSPAAGLVVYQTNYAVGLYYYDGTIWRTVSNDVRVDNAGLLIPTGTGVVSTLAGSGSSGSTNATGTAASFRTPTGVAVDAAGNVYVADQTNPTIRKITAAGVVSTYAGFGVSGSFDGSAAFARFYFPTGVSVDASGNVYVADRENYKVRMITAAGVVSTLAGYSNNAYGNTDGIGPAASFDTPTGVAADAYGNVYVADQYNNKIRKISTR